MPNQCCRLGTARYGTLRHATGPSYPRHSANCTDYRCSGCLWDVFIQQTLQPTLAGDDALQVRAEAISSDQLTPRLVNRTLELVFQFAPSKHSDIRNIALPSIKLILVSSEPREMDAEAALSGYIEIDWGACPTQTVDPIRSPPTPLQTGLVPLALDLMLRQGGCAYLPEQRVAGYLGRLLHRVSGAETRVRPIVACYHQHSKAKPLILQVIEQARDELQTAFHPATPE